MRIRFLAACGMVLILLATFSALATANDVPETGASIGARAIVPNDLKPAECAAVTIQNLVSGSGRLNGTGSVDLILGSALYDDVQARNGADCIVTGGSADDIQGRGGNDVILGGAGGDWIEGGNGNDIIYGGDGNDWIDGGGGTDVCYGGAGVDTFIDCETEVQ